MPCNMVQYDMVMYSLYTSIICDKIMGCDMIAYAMKLWCNDTMLWYDTIYDTMRHNTIWCHTICYDIIGMVYHMLWCDVTW
jgi:hypothetical protein